MLTQKSASYVQESTEYVYRKKSKKLSLIKIIKIKTL